MAPKSLAEQIADLEDLTPRDYDPEDIERGGNSSDEDVEVKDADAGREHYQVVGKAKLRNEDPVSLGKQYAGSRVSRDALDAESDEDPFAARSSDEGSDDESDDLGDGDEDEDEDEDEDISGESQDERPRKSKAPSAKGRKDIDVDMEDSDEDSEDEDEDGFDQDGFSDEDDEDDEEGFDDDEDDDESDKETAKPKRRVKFAGSDADASDDRAQLRQLMATDQKTIAATISQAAKADAVKGRAVKQQRATFDALLNARIKLQKGLTAANQLATQSQTFDDTDAEAFKSAETAALTLWSTLEDLRLTLVDAQTQDESKKRKRPAPATPSTSTSSLWKRMTELESDSLAHRRAILDKWSNKVRGSSSATTLANSKTKLIGSSGAQQTITAVLDAHVASETGDIRGGKRSKPSTTDTEEQPVYDDTIFYQSLLRDLVSQRMSSSDAITNGLDTLHLLPSRNGGAIHPVTGMRKDKVKREIDTRASKGRKMRFDVHEKLQNFMAPEERGTWTRRARDEFFASLLGRSASGLLREESGDEEEDESMRGGEESEEDAEEGGLRLFRS
ncbi:apoptosis antagonizing transcription factor-domain-containing protein [Aspergillus multicolor]|uniref:AATF family protein n=1 Tax=Aspergillus multicolor TaxID=41759 RepID=UPI003CCD8EA9